MKNKYFLVFWFLVTYHLSVAQFNSVLNTAHQNETMYETTNMHCEPGIRFTAGIIKNVIQQQGNDRLIFGKLDSNGNLVGNYQIFPANATTNILIFPNIELEPLFDLASGNCIGYVLAISISENGGNSFKPIILITDVNGNLLHQIDPLPTNNKSEFINEIIQDNSGNIVMVGSVESNGQSDLLIIRMDTNCINVEVSQLQFINADGSIGSSKGNDIVEIIPSNGTPRYAITGAFEQNSLLITIDTNLDYTHAKIWNIDDNPNTHEEGIAIVNNAASFNIVGIGREDIGTPWQNRFTYFSRFSALSFNFLDFNDMNKFNINNSASYPTDMILNVAQNGYVISGASDLCEQNCNSIEASPMLIQTDLMGNLNVATLHKGVYNNTSTGHGIIYDIELDSFEYPFAGKLWENPLTPNFEYMLGEADINLETNEACYDSTSFTQTALFPLVLNIVPVRADVVPVPELPFFTLGEIPIQQEICVEPCCSSDLNDFCNKINNYSSIINLCDVDIIFASLDSCHEVTIDWGDGSPIGVYSYNAIIQHSYATSGSYVINVTVTEYDQHMMLCYSKSFSIPLLLDCTEDCPIDCNDFNWTQHDTPFIKDMVEWNGNIVVVGSFTSLPSQNVAMWDVCLEQWVAMGDGFDFEVKAVEVFNNEVYVGGEFTSSLGVNGIPLAGIAKWDGISWTDIGGVQHSLSLNTYGTVLDLHSTGSELIVGGYFEDANNQAGILNNLAKYDGTVWSNVNISNPFSNTDKVSGIGTYNGELVVGGCFADGILRLSGGAWIGFNGGLDVISTCGNYYEGVHSIYQLGNDLYVGGSFDGAINTTAVLNTQRLAKWDGASNSWVSLANINPANSVVTDIQDLSCGLLISGSIREIDNNLINAQGLALLSSATGLWEDVTPYGAIYEDLLLIHDQCTGDCRLFAAGEGPFIEHTPPVPNPCDSLDWVGTDFLVDTLCTVNAVYDIAITPVFNNVTPDWIEYDYECNSSVDLIDNTFGTLNIYPNQSGPYQICATAFKIFQGDTCTFDWMDIIDIEDCPLNIIDCCELEPWSFKNDLFNAKHFLNFSNELYFWGHTNGFGTHGFYKYDGTNFVNLNHPNPNTFVLSDPNSLMTIHQNEVYTSNASANATSNVFEVHNFDGINWTQIGDFVWTSNPSDTRVYLTSTSVGLLAYGRFDRVNTSNLNVTNNVAIWDGVNWTSLNNIPNSSIINVVGELQSKLVFVADFGTNYNNVVVYNLLNNSISIPQQGFNLWNAAGPHWHTSHRNKLIIGGDFHLLDLNGNPISGSSGLCQFDGNTFTSVGNNYQEGVSLSGFLDGAELIISGHFGTTTNGNINAQRLCNLDWEVIKEDVSWACDAIGKISGNYYINNSGDLESSICSPISSISQNEKLDLDLRIFPNPSSDYLNIEMNSVENIKNIKVVHVSGKLILEEELETELTRINIHDWPSGVYILIVKDQREKTSTAKFIKQDP